MSEIVHSITHCDPTVQTVAHCDSTVLYPWRPNNCYTTSAWWCLSKIAHPTIYTVTQQCTLLVSAPWPYSLRLWIFNSYCTISVRQCVFKTAVLVVFELDHQINAHEQSEPSTHCDRTVLRPRSPNTCLRAKRATTHCDQTTVLSSHQDCLHAIEPNYEHCGRTVSTAMFCFWPAKNGI